MKISFTVLELIALVMLIMFAIVLFADNAFAVAPSPEALEKWKAEGSLQRNLQTWRTMKEAGACLPSEHAVSDRDARDRLSTAVKHRNVLVILVDFDDHLYINQSKAGEPAQFDSILFSDNYFNPTGSMVEYYRENSYGKLEMSGNSVGWYRMPDDYTRYIPDDINNAAQFVEASRALATDAINAAIDDGVDFSLYDNNNNGKCDGLIILHAGRGGEEGVFGVWSHKFTLASGIIANGVEIKDYVIGAEEFGSGLSPIGIITHEFGHLLGLPDLYDFTDEDGTSEGLGKWSLMASGNYNGNARTPAHLDAWSKSFILRWAPLDLLRNNLSNQAIPAVEFNPAVYVLVNNNFPNEFWFVENRQKIGFDVGLPGSGLCIYHYDPNRLNNNTPGSYMVELLQADGLDDLGFTRLNSGDAGDTWPGRTNNRNFHDFSLPSSNSSDSNRTGIAVWDISDSDSIMYADLDVEYSRPWIELDGFRVEAHGGGTVDEVLDVGDTVHVYFTAQNLMRETYNYRATLNTSNTDVDIIQGAALMSSSPSPGVHTNEGGEPIMFVMPDSIKPTIASFTVAISSDSTASGNRPFSVLFEFSLELGRPAILLVDDDRGDNYDLVYSAALANMRHPHNVWNTESDGTPPFELLAEHSIVFWHTGDSTEGALSGSDIAVMKSYLVNGGGLFLSSISGLYDMQATDPSFLADYLHTSSADSRLKWVLYAGAQESSIFTGVESVVQMWLNPIPTIPVINPIGAGEASFVLHESPNTTDLSNVCGVSFAGSFKSIFVTFPLEYIDSSGLSGQYDPADSIIARVIEFFGIGFVATSVEENEPTIKLPRTFSLKQNYPNPFNPATTIAYAIKGNGSNKPVKTKLVIYNSLGREVAVLLDKIQSPGDYSVIWGGTNSQGGQVATGIYFYRLTYDGQSETKKMVLLK